MKTKTIDITALEWFDKVNGNSYFAGTITVNYGMKTEKQFKMPLEYGYGSYYIDAASKILVKEKILPSIVENVSFTRYCRENGIILRTVKHENCKKRELTNL